jgi:hypothetical protein
MSTTQITDAPPSCCPLGLHRWQPTWSAGEFLCLRCGRRALCPACVFVPPRLPFVVLHYCDRHRSIQQESPVAAAQGEQS